MEDGTARRIGLRLLSLQAELVSDQPEVIQYCHDLFGRFVAPVSRPGYRLQLLSDGPGRWRVRDGRIEAEVTERSWLPGIVSARLLETLGNEATDLELFHGAALSRAGRGLILCGESGFGKSTLTLALLDRGWKFLSDEVAARHIERGTLEPFPKAIELRPETGRLTGLALRGPARGSGKTLHDPEELFPDCLGSPGPLAAVVFLDDGDGGGRPAAAEPLRLTVHRRNESVLESLSELDGFVGADWVTSDGGHPRLDIRCDRLRFPAWTLDEVLGRHGVLLLASSAEDGPPVAFDREPGIEPMPTHAGVQTLLGRFRGRRALSRRIEQHGGFADLFLSLHERYSGVRFYRLQVGRLAASLDLIEAAVDDGD